MWKPQTQYNIKLFFFFIEIVNPFPPPRYLQQILGAPVLGP